MDTDALHVLESRVVNSDRGARSNATNPDQPRPTLTYGLAVIAVLGH